MIEVGPLEQIDAQSLWSGPTTQSSACSVPLADPFLPFCDDVSNQIRFVSPISPVALYKAETA